MIASNTLLSLLGIPYAGLSQLDTNDLAGAVILAYRALKGGTYQSPKTLQLPQLIDLSVITPEFPHGQPLDMQKLVEDPASALHSTVVSAALQAAHLAFVGAFTSGNLPRIHAAVDAINALAPVSKQPIFVPPPDLAILSSTSGIVGQVAQRVLNGEILSPLDAWTESVLQMAVNGSGPASMQPTEFWR